MAKTAVTPQVFSFVDFDAGRVGDIANKLADEVGLPADAVIEIEINESTPLGRVRIDSLDPIKIYIEGGAIEDPTEPRHLSERLTADVIGRLLFRVKDRLSGGFDSAPPETELSLAQQTAWDTYSMGRLDRLGYDVRQPRRLYHFRNRHSFSDVSDKVFNRLWTAEGLGWGDIDAASSEAASPRTPA
jgi:hypothetical protein